MSTANRAIHTNAKNKAKQWGLPVTEQRFVLQLEN
jgi:hypothetical protein